MASTLAVLVHYDPHGEIAHHVRFTLRQLRPTADRLVFVTTATLTEEARQAARLADDVIERPNTGYDFLSWRTGLRSVADWRTYERVILTNDSVVGPLLPVADLLARQDASGAEAFGITISPQYVTHLQSYFMAFTGSVVSDPFFAAFWEAMPALDDRERVIDEYELGLARLLGDLGTPLGAYFVPSAAERRLGSSRSLRTFATRRPLAAAAYGLLRPGGAAEHDPRRGAFSPVHMLWDRALTGALPAVKVAHFTRPTRTVEKLRGDLRRLSQVHPEAFEGFRDYVARVGGPRL
jgi:hypothetical protein